MSAIVTDLLITGGMMSEIALSRAYPIFSLHSLSSIVLFNNLGSAWTNYGRCVMLKIGSIGSDSISFLGSGMGSYLITSGS